MSQLTVRPYRGRFAPSPTGPLHFGSLVAALGSYLQARQQGGQWWLRIEDIDPPREVSGASQDIIATLAALGFEWDQLSYQQQRLDHYAEALAALRDARRVYPCTCSRAQLAALPRQLQQPPVYPGTCRDRRHNPPGECALRLRTDRAQIRFEDAIQGPQAIDLEREVGDFIVRRRDRLYAYQLAVAVDDADQGMTEVVRGADLLDVTPGQIHVQQQLGLGSPQYAHLPVVTNAQGQKLSKQNLAAPLDVHQPLACLCEALRFLGQEPPAELAGADLRGFWDWAIANWQLARVPHWSQRVWP